MRPYTQMKNTPLTWIGDIPSHWKLTKTKMLFKVVSGSTPSSSVDDYWDGDIDWITPGDLSQLNSRYVEFSARRITKFGLDSCGAELVPRGSIILSTRAPIGSLAITVKRMCTNQGCKALIPARAHPAYAYYFFSISTEQLNLRGKGTTFLELSTDELKSFPFPAPPFVEQQKIAQFLDYETAKIDALIDEQKRLIELLKEKRQAVISHAVTKGLNPDAPMKDSGVEWLGQVPEHWKTTPIKHVTKTFEQGWSPQCFNEPVSNDSELGVLKVGCVKQGRFDYSENKRLPPELKFKSELAVRAGDLLISRANTRELVGSAGVPTVNHDNLMISDKLFRLKLTGQAISRFVCFFLTTKAARQQIELAATGASDSMLNIGQGTIRKMPFPCPPVEEQRQIVDYVVRVNWRLLELAGEALKLVNTLKERRSALISAAVTGKIDVRDWQPPAGSDTVDSNALVQTERHYG